MKIALIGIIKNEAHDILYWLAWHAHLGVDSFILFDDDSDDGTLALIAMASLHWDIRLYHIREHSLDLKGQHHLTRQRLVYQDALTAARGEFDWVGLFDADEYVYLRNHQTLHDFLRTMGQEIGAVALNWQLRGHNGHVAMPNLPSLASFNRRSTEQEPINRHIKSFIRPDYWDENHWVNVHYFSLSKGNYVMPDGQPVIWSQTKGRTEDQVDWSTALLIHLQNRSVEQFVKRQRDRNDIQLRWTDQQFNQWNDIEDQLPRQTMTALLNQIRPVIRSGVMNALEQIRTAHPPAGQPLPLSPEQTSSAFTIFALHPQEMRHLSLENGLICDRQAEGSESDVQLYLLQSKAKPQTGFLFALNAYGEIADFILLSDLRPWGLRHYEFLPILGQHNIALRQVNNLRRRGAFLSSPPDEPLISDRRKADLWESFTLTTQPTAPSGASWLSLPLLNFAGIALQSSPTTLQDISGLTAIDRYATAWLLPLLAAHMDTQQNRELSSYLGALAPFIL